MAKRGKLADIDPADLGAALLVTVGTAAAADHFAGDGDVACDNCGAALRHVFVMSAGYHLGGDCLASLTGDDSTRAAIVTIGKKHARKSIVHVFTLLGAVTGRTAEGEMVRLVGRPSYMDLPGKIDRDLAPAHREKVNRLAAGLATVFGATLETT